MDGYRPVCSSPVIYCFAVIIYSYIIISFDARYAESVLSDCNLYPGEQP